MMNRRRFLTISACALAAPTGAQAAVWEGRGLGGAVSLRLEGADPGRAALTFDRVRREIDRIESLFSLHQDSALSRLNRDGRLAWPAPELLEILALAGRVHEATGGAFDPTVQPLWRAIAEGGDAEQARALVGFERVRVSPEDIRLEHGQALTLNGIAQGWAADRIAALLKREGYVSALIDMGEIAAIGARPDGGAWRAAIADPEGRILGEAALRGRALAVSSPRGTLIGRGRSHIIDPSGQAPRWETIAVSAPDGALADALSTAFCVMDRTAIAATLAAFPDASLNLAARD